MTTKKKVPDKIKKQPNSFQVDSNVLKIEDEEINYELDEDPELENNASLIKYEFNMIELPFFTKDKKIEDGKARKYIFSERNKSYMRVIPSGDPELISNKIPQEFDEKIFYGILKLSKEQKSKEVITDYFTLARASNVHYNHKERIKDSIQRLSNCKIELNNLFYSSVLKTNVKGSKPFMILQHAFTFSLEKESEFPADKKEVYKKYFRNSKITEILVLSISDVMYQNIESKGFLYFNQKMLLDIDNATSRKLYMLVTKWHGWEKKPEIKRSCRLLASRIPLSWEKKSIHGTINCLESACETLKKKHLISDFDLTRTKPVDNSYIVFRFEGVIDRVTDYNLKAAAVTTGHEIMTIDGIEDEFLDDRQTNIFDIETKNDLEELYDALPERYRTESNKGTISLYTQKGAEYIKSSIEYAVKNHKENFDAYLRMTLEKDWARSEREKTQLRKKKEMAAIKSEEKKEDALKTKALDIITNLSKEELRKYSAEAENQMYYKMVLKDKIARNEITREAAIQEAVFMYILGQLSTK